MMPPLLNQPFPTEVGRIRTNDPPAHLLHDAIAHVNAAILELPPNADGALVGVATETGANAAIVMKTPFGFQVVGWIGKNWGESITYGAEVQKVWKWGA
jgi:hypothetical protein